jgi:hypothetical protein
MVTFGQLESRARTLYEAASSVRWPSSKFLDAANDGLDELSEATGFYERFVTIPLKGGQTYYDLRGFVPDDAFQLNSVFNAADQVWLKPIGIGDLLTPRWETVPGSPQRYLVRGAFWLGIYPRPSSDVGTIRVYYSGIAPHLADSYSVIPADLPDDYVPALEDYTMYDLSTKDGETDKALEHWNSYRKREDSLAVYVKERIVRARTGHLSRWSPIPVGNR